MTISAAPAVALPPLLLLALLACTRPATADEVLTANGDRLSGTILKADAHSVLLRTPYAGVIQIERAQVRGLRRGSRPDDALTQPTPLAEPDTQVSAPAQVLPEAAEPAPPLDARRSPFTPGTDFGGRVDFALSDEKGNADKAEVDFDYRVEYRRGWNRLKSFGALEFDTNNNEKTTDKWSTFNQYDRLFPSRWYGAAWVALEHDRFSDLRLRTLGGPAVGYLAFEGEALNLALQAGPTVLQEDYYGQPDQDFFGAAWSITYDQLVWQDRLQPYHRQFGYLGLDAADKLIWQSWTGVRVPLAGGFSGALEFEYDYDSNPALQAKTTDTTLRLKLGYEW
jgi:putative salt-induced outer membrane protein YdiY